MGEENKEKAVTFVYKNYRGETSTRTVKPISITFGINHFHKEEQWLMKAYDFDKSADRIFAMRDINNWKEVK